MRYLPPNSTALHQPCDQGVIRALKARYKKAMLARILQTVDEWEELRARAKRKTAGTRGLADAHNANLLDVAKLLKQIWDNMEPSVVINAWLKANCLPAQHVCELKAISATLSNSASASSCTQLPASLSEQTSADQAGAQSEDLPPQETDSCGLRELAGLVAQLVDRMNVEEIKARRPELSDSVVCDAAAAAAETVPRLEDLLKHWLTIEDDPQVLNEVIDIEFQDPDDEHDDNVGAATAQSEAADEEQGPDAETITFDKLPAQPSRPPRAPDCAQVQAALDVLSRYCSAHGLDTAMLAQLRKHSRGKIEEEDQKVVKRQRQQTLTEIFRFCSN